MGNIAYIGPAGRGEVTPVGEPLADAIEILEEMLAEAKAGKLAAMAVTSIVEEGVLTTKRAFTYKGGCFAALYVATDQLMCRIRNHLASAEDA